MILYSISELKSLSNIIYKQLSPIANLSLGKSEFAQYINGEWHARLDKKVRGQECLIFGSFTPPANQLLRTLILAHTLKKEGAKKVIVVLPYLAYTRHDRIEPFQSFMTDLIGKISVASGIDKIITIDIHSQTAGALMGVPVTNISSAELFLSLATKADLENATIVAPDQGARERANEFRQMAGITRPIAYFKKIRSQGKIKHTGLIGKISDNVILIDDVLDTGFTLISCVKQLKKRGVKKITIAVTHGLFMGESWPQLFKLNVSKIITTDSTPNPLLIKNKKIQVVSCSTLLAKIIKSDIL